MVGIVWCVFRFGIEARKPSNYPYGSVRIEFEWIGYSISNPFTLVRYEKELEIWYLLVLVQYRGRSRTNICDTHFIKNPWAVWIGFDGSHPLRHFDGESPSKCLNGRVEVNNKGKTLSHTKSID